MHPPKTIKGKSQQKRIGEEEEVESIKSSNQPNAKKRRNYKKKLSFRDFGGNWGWKRKKGGREGK